MICRHLVESPCGRRRQDKLFVACRSWGKGVAFNMADTDLVLNKSYIPFTLTSQKKLKANIFIFNESTSNWGSFLVQNTSCIILKSILEEYDTRTSRGFN
jgi:hypothetical protein